MNLGQLLSGAGVIGRAWREEEDAQRRSRELELRTAELNRLERLRQEMLNTPMPEPTQGFQSPLMEKLPVQSVDVPQQKVVSVPSAATQSVPSNPLSNFGTFGVTAGATSTVTPPTPTNTLGVPKQPAPSAETPTNNASGPYRLTIDSKQLPRVVPEFSSQIEADQVALSKIPAALGDVVWAGLTAIPNTLKWIENNVAPYRSRFINAIVGREVSSPKYFPYTNITPLYDRFVRLREQDALNRARNKQREQIQPTSPMPDLQTLLTAMIQVESGGNPNAVSNKGAVGLMQVLPSTAMNPGFDIPNVFQVAEQLGVKVNNRRDEAEAKRLLSDPKVGAAFGQMYMKALLAKYRNNLEYALAAYNAGPARIDKWLDEGADFSKLPKETQAYIPKVLAALNKLVSQQTASTTSTATAPASTPAVSTSTAAAPAVSTPATSAASGALTNLVAGLTIPTTSATPQQQQKYISPSQFYLANPQAIPLEMQRAMQQRAELAQLANMYQRAGMGLQYMQARAKLMELDNNMIYLQGMQGLQEFAIANDPRRLAAVWSQFVGMPIGIQPRTDGKFNIIVNGTRTMEGVTADVVTDLARSAFDSAYRQQKAAASAEYNKEAYKTQLKSQEEILKAQLGIQQENAKQLAQMIREIAVERAKGNVQLALEQMKRWGYDVKPTGAGDGTFVIIPPNGDVPYLYNATGRTIEVDGVKITAYSAYPIPGLPTYTR